MRKGWAVSRKDYNDGDIADDRYTQHTMRENKTSVGEKGQSDSAAKHQGDQ